MLLLFISLLISLSTTAQSGSAAAKGLFLEGGGLAPYYSLNYTHRLFESENLSGYFRIGAGIWKNNLALPLGITLSAGRGDHHPEITLGVSPYSEGLQFWDREESDLKVDLVLGLAYRYQARGRSFFFSMGIFPFLRLDPTENELSEEEGDFGFRPTLSVGKFF